MLRFAPDVNQNIKYRTMKKYSYVVDLTSVDSCEDIQLEFIKAKALAGVKITEDEFKFIVKYGAELAFDAIDAGIEALVKSSNYHKIEDDALVQDMLKLIEKHTKPKKPWYKRLWAWITRKK